MPRTVYEEEILLHRNRIQRILNNAINAAKTNNNKKILVNKQKLFTNLTRKNGSITPVGIMRILREIYTMENLNKALKSTLIESNRIHKKARTFPIY